MNEMYQEKTSDPTTPPDHPPANDHPLSAAQRGVWLLAQKTQGLPTCNFPYRATFYFIQTLRKECGSSLFRVMMSAFYTLLHFFSNTPPITADLGGNPRFVDLLTEPSVAEAGERGSGTAPRTELEASIAEVWSEVLAVESPSVDDDFFELGGHSLKAVRCLALLERRLGLEIRLEDLFHHATIAELAAHLGAASSADGGTEISEIPHLGELPAYPLSQAQLWQWFHYQIQDGEALQPPQIVWLDGALDRRGFFRALTFLSDRHAALRTSFREVGGEPVQAFDDDVVPDLAFDDLNTLEASERRGALGRVIESEARKPFDLGHPPLLRARLVRLEENRHVFLFNLPHIVSDGWTERRLLDDLAEIYSALVSGQKPELDELPLRYVDFAAWQRKELEAPRALAQRDHWLERFRGAGAAVDLPADPHAGTFAGPAYGRIEAPTAAALRRLASESRTTLFSVLLAAFQALLARWTGRRDLVIGTVVNGRIRSELKDIAGVFINPVALPVAASLPAGERDDPSFNALLGAARDAVLEAFRHQDYPFHAWVDALRRERGDDWLPCSCWLLLQEQAPAPSFAGLEARHQSSVEPLEEVDVTPPAPMRGQNLLLNVEENADGGLGMALVNGDGRLRETTLAALLRQFGRVLEQAATRSDLTLSRLELCSDVERRRLDAFVHGAAGPAPSPALRALVAGADEATVAALLPNGTSRRVEGLDALDPHRLARCLARLEATAILAPPDLRKASTASSATPSARPGWRSAK